MLNGIFFIVLHLSNNPNFTQYKEVNVCSEINFISAYISEMALWSVLQIRIGKQNVEIIDVYVEIEKCKNELFQIS